MLPVRAFRPFVFTSLVASVLLATLSFPVSVHAMENVTGHVTQIGCHYTDNICYVTLDSANFGASLGCASPGQQFRFDAADTEPGKRAYASFMAAYLAQKTVAVALDGCSAQGYPTLRYFSVM